MNKIVRKSFPFGALEGSIETGRIARQSDAVVVRVGDTVVLVTAVVERESSERDFLPLTVDYQERMYAAGRIPGSFFRREGRPTEKETLTARLIDRPIRPLFPKGFYHEAQVVCTVLSADPNVDPDMPAMIGASAALSLSGAPFAGPIAAARVGYINNHLVANPSPEQLADSELNLVVAGTEQAVLMVESEANLLSEQLMLDAVMYGHEKMQPIIAAIRELVAEAGDKDWKWQQEALDGALLERVKTEVDAPMRKAYGEADKMLRRDALRQVRADVVASLCPPDADSSAWRWSEKTVKKAIDSHEKNLVRSNILNGEKRIDGRDQRTVRPIDSMVSILPRTHGSALFTRGETQALVTVTLGSGRDGQLIERLEGETRESFMMHYNFPPYSVGETGRMGGPGRREMGHGRLARRGLQAIMPDRDDFPYVLRVVSEITESNGSSSMASVCGASLAMMDAGVPLKEPVAGIAMGLIKEEERFVVLSDILGDEDHLGDMDFKVAGSATGVSALQMDIKINGITREIMAQALDQAREARLHILEKMGETLSHPRQDLSEHAPRFLRFRIDPSKIAAVIGRGGSVIRSLTEETGASIDIEDDGTISVASADKQTAEEVRRRIDALTADVEVGCVYSGRVAKVMDFGAFVTILPGKDGLVHISQISEERVQSVSDKLSEGDVVKVKVLEIDKQGRIRLSMKAVL